MTYPQPLDGEPPLVELVRELGNLLVSASRSSTRIRRGVTSSYVDSDLRALEEAIDDSIACVRGLQDEISRAADAPPPKRESDRPRDSVRIDLRGVTDDHGPRVSAAIRHIAVALGGEMEVHPDPGRAGAFVVHVSR
jgi:hypothetical protein